MVHLVSHDERDEAGPRRFRAGETRDVDVLSSAIAPPLRAGRRSNSPYRASARAGMQGPAGAGGVAVWRDARRCRDIHMALESSWARGPNRFHRLEPIDIITTGLGL
jgi:hypothetical protein